MFDWLPYNTRIVLLGTALLGATSGLVGAFALLRRRALIGDALAHATLPGLGVAFLLTGRRDFPTLFLGAFLAGLAGLVVLAVIKRFTRIREDAGLALVLGTFYGGGVALMSYIQSDPNAAQAGLETFLLGSAPTLTSTDVTHLAWLALALCVLVAGLFKEFKLLAFDATFAAAQGWPVHWLDFLLSLMLLAVVVLCLPAVGALMAAALIVIPAATARLWTRRFFGLLLLSSGLGAIAGVVGTLWSAHHAVSAGPAVVLCAAGFFFVSMIFATDRGMLARWRTHRQQRQRWLLSLRQEREGAAS